MKELKNLNIDVMKELKNLEAIRELLASHPIYTYDYSDGLLINKEDTNIQVYSIDLEDEPFADYISGYIITYASEEVLFENLRENIISHMDLTKGADDQYYDDSPSQVEAILFDRKMGIRPQGNRNLPTTCSIRII